MYWIKFVLPNGKDAGVAGFAIGTNLNKVSKAWKCFQEGPWPTKYIGLDPDSLVHFLEYLKEEHAITGYRFTLHSTITS